jgi:hypothetical protein
VKLIAARINETLIVTSPSPSFPIDRAMTCIGKHRLIIQHFDKTHFDQCPEIVRTDRRQFCPVGFDIAEHPAKMDSPT